MAVPKRIYEIEAGLVESFKKEFGRGPTEVERKLLFRYANILWMYRVTLCERRKVLLERNREAESPGRIPLPNRAPGT